MCGIAGFLGDFPSELLTVMQQSIAHRGPDGHGVWYAPEQSVGLAHRRLSIIDLSAAAAQPMAAVQGRYQLTYNGEIYNFKKLAHSLQQDYTFNPHSDTAVLAPLYDKHGPDMLHKLNGMFAFAIWDQHTRELFLARDQVGIKPLYYTITPRGLVFASELRALLHVQDLDTTLDADALLDYTTFLWSPGARTPLQSIRKLNPGHYLKVKLRHLEQGGWPTPQRYYAPPLPQRYTAKRAGDLWQVLQTVVREQSIADVPVGAFLSGGVDSSAIVAAMAAQNIRPQHTYCITFPRGASMADEGFTDDSHYARAVAQHLGVKLTEVPADPTGLDRLPELVSMLEEPLADPAPLYVHSICERARSDGVKVLHSGTGGDDVFAGYRRHLAAVWYEKLSILSPLLGIGCGALAGITHGPFKRRLQKLQYMFGGTEYDVLSRAFEFAPFIKSAELFQPHFLHSRQVNSENRLKSALRDSVGQRVLNRMLFMEFHGFLPDHNLTYTDKAAMWASTEVRVPLLDLQCLQFAHDLPIHQKIHGNCTKYLLKAALRGILPNQVLDRSKAGFGAPVRHWLCHERQDLVFDILFNTRTQQRGIFNPIATENLYGLTQLGHVDGAYTILSLMMQELWCRQFLDQRPTTRH